MKQVLEKLQVIEQQESALKNHDMEELLIK